MEKVPQYLNAPFTVLFWSSDEFVIIILFITLALAFGGYPLWILAFIGPFGYVHFKRKYNRGFLKHLIYMSGLKTFEGYPSTFERDFME
ncbi:MAG TPA: type IV conjugative transfer system protein TraL [Deltaproteobacteria bacterium]|nr:type IV conjugative transfer system protein TraL [Deltaproteobacteria bacterium]